MQPRVLSAAAVVVWSKDEKKQLQRVENRVWGQILGAPIYTPVAALQGEIGASSVGGHEDEAKVCKLHGKHCKWAAGSYFLKADQRSKTKDMGKTAQRVFRGIGTLLLGCEEDGYR